MTSSEPNDGFLVDSYERWLADEGIPVHRGFAVDMAVAEVAAWPRFGVRGAVVNLQGRGDFLDLWLLELPPGGSTDQVHHLCETAGYVIEGHGTIEIEGTGEQSRTVEWGPRSMFAIPLNARYRLRNADSSKPAKIALTTSFPIMMNLLRNEEFIFDAKFRFTERYGADELYTGGGCALEHTTSGITRHFWESNSIFDLADFDRLSPMQYRGKGKAVRFLMADSSLHGHVSEIPAGQYKKAHRHMGGSHIYSVTGVGYSLLWYEGDSERVKIDWHHGVVHAPPDNMYHQHFNIGTSPARYFAVKMGNYRYPITSRMDSQMRASLSEKVARKDQIEYEDEDPAIRQLYEDALQELARRTSNL